MSTERLQIAFLGLNEADDPKNLPPGTMLRALNVQMDKTRRLIKRRGTAGLTKATVASDTIVAGNRILPTADGALNIVGNGASSTTAYAYASSLATPKWAALDFPPPWRATRRPHVDSTRSVSAVDIAISGSMLVTIYVTATGGAFVQVDDLATGQPLMLPLPLAGALASWPRVLINGTTAYLFYASGGTIEYQLLNLTTLAFGTAGSLVTNSTASAAAFDACIGTPTAGVATLYIIYELAAGASRTRIASFTLSTLVAIATKDSSGTTLSAAQITFCSAAQRVAAVFSSVANVSTYVTTMTTLLASQVGPTSVGGGVISGCVLVAENDATNVLVGWWKNILGTDADKFTTALYSIAATAQVAISERITFGVVSVARPWKTGSRWFSVVMTSVHPYAGTTDPIAQPSTLVVEIETATSLTGVQDSTHPQVATLENMTGWSSSGLPATPVADSSGSVWIASPYRNREPDNYSSVIPLGWNLYRLALAEADTWRAAPIGTAALLAGATPSWLDGGGTLPYGFAHAPQIISVTAAAGGAVVAGTYSYVATYAWRDANGVLHRSAPSAPKTGVTAAANLTLVVKVATSSLSGKQRTRVGTSVANPVLIELWRTTIGGTGPHYRLTLEPSYQVLVNDATNGDVSLSDTKADANIASGAPAVTLASQAQLYTDLGELENIPPPSLITVATHRGRLAGIGPDLRTLWMSKDSTLDATIAPGFNEALTLAFSRDKSALASLDTVLVVFGTDTIDVVQGDGPDDKGDQNTWQIQAIQTDVGCRNPRSIAVAPMGVLFESRRGIELLDRSLNTSWVGKVVDDTLSTYPTITSGVLVAELGEVRWTCDNGTNGIVLAFDYINKCWFTRTYTDASDTAGASIRFVDAALINGVYTLLTAGGQVYREVSTSSLDGGISYVETDVLLAPISAQPGRSGWSNDNLAWQRAKDLTLMGTSVADHDLEISFARDYATTFEQTKRFLADSDVCLAGPLEKARVTIVNQKCQAIQIRIRDLTPTSCPIAAGSAGIILESLCLRVGSKDGPAKTSAGQQA